MYLENIYSPADVKKLSVKELNELNDEIRVSLLQNLKSATIIQYTIKGRFMSR